MGAAETCTSSAGPQAASTSVSNVARSIMCPWTRQRRRVGHVKNVVSLRGRWHGVGMRWLWGVVVLAGCSVALEDWGRASGQARCERAQRCGSLSRAIDCTRPGVWSDASVEKVEFDRQHVGYSASAAAACIARIKEDVCSVVSDFTPECRAAFPGKLQEGAPCGLPLRDECGPGLVCLVDAPSLCGRCVTATERGQPLTSDHPCAWGLVRAPGAGDAAICEPRVGPGESCSQRACVEWLACTRATGTCEQGAPSVTSAIGEVGDACDVPDFRRFDIRTCLPGLICTDGACVALSAFNAACEEDADCLSHHCGAEGLCTAPRAPDAPLCP